MAVKVFNREGLRRDRNLSDLVDPQSAINNILATPTMLGNNESFTVDDLFPIQNIYVTNITGSTFNSLNGVTITFTVVNDDGTIDNAANPRVYFPLIKIKNRLDTAYFSTGEPFFFGGNGPNASYYDADKIIRTPQTLVLDKIYTINEIVNSGGRLYRTATDAQTSVALTHTIGSVNGFEYVANYDETTVFLNVEQDTITGEDITIRDNFWERGQFIYGSKVQSSFISLFGGVRWQGFFKPITSGISRFYLRTTGSTWFKFQDPGTQSFATSRYGKVNTTDLLTDSSSYPGYTTALYNKLNDIIQDPTRILVEIRLNDPITLKDNDFIYIEAAEGPTVSRQYRILTLNAEYESIDKFWIEVTEDYNLKNVDPTTLPFANVTPGSVDGFRSIIRYYPYENRQLKTYLNSIYHKLWISSFTINSATTFTVNDDFQYYHIMENDYIYDYRLRNGENQGVRRWIVTGLNDSTKTVTVELDTTYNFVNDSNYNDQVAYVNGLSVTFEEVGTEIDTTYTSGALNSAISGASPTFNLYFVGRYAETTLRTKFITIDQFLESYVDYAFDWLYYTKDEDADPATQNKAWLLWYRSETSGAFRPLNYKYLYDKNYEFYQIGDFKVFLDNAVGAGGTSRESGIEQRAFGAEQLLNPGDQYNELFSLLPVRSNYTPRENWNSIALSRTISLTDDSRLMSFSTTDVDVGNYIVQDSDIGFISGDSIPARTRIIDIVNNSSSVITSKQNNSGGSISGFVLDHNGFVTTGVLTYSNNDYLVFEGDGSEIQVGMCVMLKGRASEPSYTRVTRVEYDDVNDNYQIILDKPHETLFDGVGSFYASDEQITAVNGTIPASGNPYFVDIVPSNADLNYGSPGGGTAGGGTNTFNLFDGDLNNTWVYWTGANEYTQGNVSRARFDLRDFPTVSSVRVRCLTLSGYYGYKFRLLNSSKSVISGTTVQVTSTTSSWLNIPVSGTPRYLEIYTDLDYPSVLPRVYLYGIEVNGTILTNNAINTTTDRCAIYYDRGVDITKPLAAFCNGSSCGQNRYSGENAVAQHIALFVGKGIIPGNDARWSNPQNGQTTFLNNNQAQVAEWRDYQPNIMTESNITAKTYRSNAIYAKFAGTSIGSQLSGLGHPNFPLNDYVPFAHIEAMVRIKGEIWDGTNDKIKTVTTGFSGSVANNTTFQITVDNLDDLESASYVYPNGYYCIITSINTNTKVLTLRNQSGATRTFNIQDNSTLTFGNQIYYFIARLSDSWQSLYDFDTTADGIQVGKRLDFTQFASSDWNMQFLAFPTRQDQYYTNGGNINALSTLTSYYNSFSSYRDRFFEVTSPLTLTSTELAYFFNPTSFAPTTGTTYIIDEGSYLFFSGRAGDKIVWFRDFDDFQGEYSCYSLHPTYAHTTSPGNLSSASENNLGNLKNQNLISLQPQDGPAFEVLPQGSTNPLDMPFRYLHYRRKQYELLPLHYNFEDTFKALRLINPRVLDSYTTVEKTLQNSVNKLSVFTFANTTDNKELCCPPLDTSPPFDSSAIGLATTVNEPDMSIGGLVNVRSISGNHPDSKIHNIPSGQSNTSLPVDKKLEIVFGGLKYDLLISDSKPF